MSVRIRLPNPLAALDDRALLARFADQRDRVSSRIVITIAIPGPRCPDSDDA